MCTFPMLKLLHAARESIVCIKNDQSLLTNCPWLLCVICLRPHVQWTNPGKDAARRSGAKEQVVPSARSQPVIALWRNSLGSVQGLGLCHGISGNAYALVAAARASGRPHAHQAAVQYGLFMAEHWEKLHPLPDHPSSLFEVTSQPAVQALKAFSSRLKKRLHACPLQSFQRCSLKQEGSWAQTVLHIAAGFVRQMQPICNGIIARMDACFWCKSYHEEL